jgi:hypothetical protein
VEFLEIARVLELDPADILAQLQATHSGPAQ